MGVVRAFLLVRGGGASVVGVWGFGGLLYFLSSPLMRHWDGIS